MFVQGLGLKLLIERNARLERNPPNAKAEPPPRSLFATDDVYEPGDIANRADLLKSIQRKIKSGFYNSESVLDDLSHGFAKALDQTL